MAKFGGHQSFAERERSFHAEDQTLQCEFVRAPDGERWTGFELSKRDKEYLDTLRTSRATLQSLLASSALGII